MIAYFKEYRQISKAGLLQASHHVILLVALLMLLFGRYIGMELEILVFILSSIGYMIDMDTNKYVISYSMPISITRRLHLIYYITILGGIISSAMVNLSYYFPGSSRSLFINLIVFLVQLIGCDVYYYMFGSQEFKKDVLDDGKSQIIYQCVIGGLIGISIAMRLKKGMNSSLEQMLQGLGFVEKVLMIAVLASFTIWCTKKSMNHLEQVVRNERKRDDRGKSFI